MAKSAKSATEKSAAASTLRAKTKARSLASSPKGRKVAAPLPTPPLPKASGANAKPKLRPIRRVVTGHDDHGRSISIIDHNSPHRVALKGVATYGLTDIWKTFGAPADNRSNEDAIRGPVALEPPPLGSILRVVEFPPDKEFLKASGTDAATHPLMHRTNTIDYIIVLDGEIHAVLDRDEIKLKAGDILVQRGTNHGWANRSNKPCIVAAVLINAKPLPYTGH